jgi:hypothetical protein
MIRGVIYTAVHLKRYPNNIMVETLTRVSRIMVKNIYARIQNKRGHFSMFFEHLFMFDVQWDIK